MHHLIEKLFSKRGIKDFDELDNTPMSDGSPTERQTFEQWNSILSRNADATLEDVKKFCQSQIDVIEMRWRDLNIEQSKKSEWIPYHTTYKLILLATEAPRSERELLEKTLTQLITQ